MVLLPPPRVSALALALPSLVVPGCGPVPARGPLWTAQPTHDFGRVFEGSTLEHEWVLDVRAATAVSAAKTDCGCALLRLERGPAAARGARVAYELGSSLTPGERLYVEGRYDTRGRRGPTQRALTLTLGSGAVFPLGLLAEVQPWLQAEPSELDFTRVLEGEGAERSFQVRTLSGERVRLRATGVALPPWVTLRLSPESPDDTGRAALWHVHVALGPEAPRGTFRYPLEMESDVAIPGPAAREPGASGEERRFTIAPAWTLQVVGPVALSTPHLEFGLVHADETVARTVILESFDPAFTPRTATARLEPVKAGDAFPLARTAEVRTRPESRGCAIEVTLAGLDREVAPAFLGKLVVETGHPALPRLEALVRGVRAPSERTGSRP